MIRVTRDITIDEKDLDIAFVRASGPGGQNVNKLSTAAQLRFDINRISLAPDMITRLTGLAGQRMTKEGIIVIHAQRFRTQERNRQDARERVAAFVATGLRAPTPRVATKPSRAAKQRRLDAKHQRGGVKRERSRKDWD